MKVQKIKVEIPVELLNKWKKEKSTQIDDICVEIGAYMRKHNVSREEAIKELDVPDPRMM
jgi:hypothetical protein